MYSGYESLIRPRMHQYFSYLMGSLFTLLIVSFEVELFKL